MTDLTPQQPTPVDETTLPQKAIGGHGQRCLTCMVDATALRRVTGAAPDSPERLAFGLPPVSEGIHIQSIHTEQHTAPVDGCPWCMASKVQQTAPLAPGPLVRGNCPACKQAKLFLGTGGYITCNNPDCTETDAAVTVLEQYGAEARPPQHTWRVETRDPLPDEWAPGSHFASRPHAVERYETANSTAPLWQDGTPVERRIVRETTTFTVEEPQPRREV